MWAWQSIFIQEKCYLRLQDPSHHPFQKLSKLETLSLSPNSGLLLISFDFWYLDPTFGLCFLCPILTGSINLTSSCSSWLHYLREILALLFPRSSLFGHYVPQVVTSYLCHRKLFQRLYCVTRVKTMLLVYSFFFICYTGYCLWIQRW